jgi:hypothetical protein
LGDARYAEAQAVRSDAKYNLPAGAHILYGGDWNLFNGSYENAYKCLTGQTTSDGINWSDTSSVWANTNQTQGYDPMSRTTPPTTVTWTNAAVDNATYLYADTTTSLASRIDIQLPNALMFAAYNSQGGVQLVPDTADPFDLSNFPAAQYPYAFETFGNDGSTLRSSTSTDASNHSLNDLAGTVPSAVTVYADLLEAGTSSGSTFVGSDHYPIFGDYNIMPPPLVLTSQGFATNQNFRPRQTWPIGPASAPAPPTRTDGWSSRTLMPPVSPAASTAPTGRLRDRRPAFTDTNRPAASKAKVRCAEKIAVATPRFSVNFNIPFAKSAEGKRPQNFAFVWMRSGHNNIKHQSRVPRDASENPKSQPKEKLC